MWSRDTPWRQGHVLKAASATDLGIRYPEEGAETVALVVSHDCDLANEIAAEPNCEILVGRAIDKEDGNYTAGKNARKLQLAFRAGDVALIGEFDAWAKIVVSKEKLDRLGPADAVRLDYDGLIILQLWLAARYRRASFPDEFQERMAPIRSKLAKILERTGANIRAIFFNVDDNRELKKNGPEDVYELLIVLTYDSEIDGSEKVAMKARTEILALFRKEFKTGAAWSNIELRDCMVVSDEALSVRQTQKLKKWDADYLSLRVNPQQAVVEV